MFLTSPLFSDIVPCCFGQSRFFKPRKYVETVAKKERIGFFVTVNKNFSWKKSLVLDNFFCSRPAFISCLRGSLDGSLESGNEKTFGFVALLGKTNSGKSTLLNALVETKVAIVTPRVQTTRSKVVGVFTQGNSQVAFMDTPGIFTPKKRLERAMIEVARRAWYEADLIVLVVDAAKASVSRDDLLDDTTLEMCNLCKRRKSDVGNE